MNIKTFLQGKKTYLVAVAGIAVIALYHLHYITPELTSELLYLLGFTGLSTLRAGVKSALTELEMAQKELDTI